VAEIIVIGGVMINIEGYPFDRLIYGDINSGKINIHYGGTGRNIAGNLGRMGASVSFCSAVGDDFIGKAAAGDLSSTGVDISGIKFMPEENTAAVISILDPLDNLELALCGEDNMERVNADFIAEAAKKADNAEIIALDTDLLPDILGYAVKAFSGKPLFLDVVSAIKAERAKNVIEKIHTIRSSRRGAEVLSGIKITDPAALDEAALRFVKQGVRQVFVTLSDGGVYYRNNKAESGTVRPDAPCASQAKGAEHAFSAAILYCFCRGYDIHKTAAYGMAAASIAMESRLAVNPLMSVAEIEGRIR
jgi:pseudouridine kinase